MTSRNRSILTISSILLGGFSLVVFSKISRDIIFDGLSICSSSSIDIGLGVLTLFTSSLLAGFMASIVVMRDNFIPHLVMSAFLIGQMFFISNCEQWAQIGLEIGLNISLIFGLWIGNYTALKFPLAPI